MRHLTSRAALLVPSHQEPLLRVDMWRSLRAAPIRVGRMSVTATHVPLRVTLFARSLYSRSNTLQPQPPTAAPTVAPTDTPDTHAIKQAEQTPPRTLLLIDASGIIFRQYFGMKHRSSPVHAHVPNEDTSDTTDGVTDTPPTFTPRNVSALYGYASSILHLCARLQPTHVAACMDLGRTSFRHALFPDYKGGRKPIEDDLRWQLSQLARVTRSLGIQPLSSNGFEADDVIGTLARSGSESQQAANGDATSPRFDRVVILSNDKDFIQCLTPTVSMLSPKSGAGISYVWTHHDDAISQFGVPPSRFIDFLILLGDAVDGIPGVDGIGEKKAATLLKHYEKVDHILDAIRKNQKLPVMAAKKVATALLEAESKLELWRELATIRTDIPNLLPNNDWEHIAYKNPFIAPPSTSAAAGSQLASGGGSDAVGSSAALSIIDLYRQFNFPNPPSMADHTSEHDKKPTTPNPHPAHLPPPHSSAGSLRLVVDSLTSASSSSSSLRMLTHSEWTIATKKKAGADSKDRSVVAQAKRKRKEKTRTTTTRTSEFEITSE